MENLAEEVSRLVKICRQVLLTSDDMADVKAHLKEIAKLYTEVC
jgi:hypothetical protein